MTGFMCADEMSLQPGMGTPGGDFAEFIVALGVLEELGLTEGVISDALAFDLLVKWLQKSNIDTMRWCVDDKFLDTICRQLLWCPHDVRFVPISQSRKWIIRNIRFSRSLLFPPPHLVNSLLDMVVKDELAGNRHIRAMLLHNEK